jgi:hypothetical protein
MLCRNPLIHSQISDEIAKLKYKEPQSTKIVQLEQELVRAEAQSLVAEAQLSNIVSASVPSNRCVLTCTRHGRNSRRPTTFSSHPPSSAPRNRSSWPNTPVDS